MGGCCATVRPGRSRRCCGVHRPGIFFTPALTLTRQPPNPSPTLIRWPSNQPPTLTLTRRLSSAAACGPLPPTACRTSYTTIGSQATRYDHALTPAPPYTHTPLHILTHHTHLYTPSQAKRARFEQHAMWLTRESATPSACVSTALHATPPDADCYHLTSSTTAGHRPSLLAK